MNESEEEKIMIRIAERKAVNKIMDRAHWAILHCDCIKSPTESQYNRGYLKGWNDNKKIMVDIMKKAVELVKKI